MKVVYVSNKPVSYISTDRARVHGHLNCTCSMPQTGKRFVRNKYDLPLLDYLQEKLNTFLKHDPFIIFRINANTVIGYFLYYYILTHVKNTASSTIKFKAFEHWTALKENVFYR